MPISDRLLPLCSDHPLYQCAALAYHRRSDAALLVALLCGWPQKPGQWENGYQKHVAAMLHEVGATDKQIADAWGITEGAARARRSTYRRDSDEDVNIRIRIEVARGEPLDPSSSPEVVREALGFPQVLEGAADEDRHCTSRVLMQLAEAGKLTVIDEPH